MSNLPDVLQQINSLLKELNSLPAIAEKDEVRLWRKFRLEWNYNSNHIEGNTLTYGETMLLLIKGKTTGDHNIREYDEMKAHDVAVDVVKNWATSEVRPFNSGDICDLNRTLLVRPFWKDAITPTGEPTQKQIIPGQYKTTPNHVKLPNGEIFRYTEPEDVQREMQELIDWYRDETADLHPLITAAMLHYRFVCIHPFDDGNGRVSRLLMNYHLMKNDMPPIIIKSDDKKNYLTALSKADAGDEESFIIYVGEQLLWSLELAVKARKGENIEEQEDWEKRVALLASKIEAKEKQKKQKKSNRKLATKKWLATNVPLLIDEFYNVFKPFEKLYDNHSFFIQIEDSGDYPVDEGYGIKILSSFHEDNITVSKLRLKYTVTDFIPTEAKMLFEADLTIQINSEQIFLRTSHKDIKGIDKSIFENINNDDILIVRRLGERLYSFIEDSSNDVIPF